MTTAWWQGQNCYHVIAFVTVDHRELTFSRNRRGMSDPYPYSLGPIARRNQKG